MADRKAEKGRWEECVNFAKSLILQRQKWKLQNMGLIYYWHCVTQDLKKKNSSISALFVVGK